MHFQWFPAHSLGHVSVVPVKEFDVVVNARHSMIDLLQSNFDAANNNQTAEKVHNLLTPLRYFGDMLNGIWLNSLFHSTMDFITLFHLLITNALCSAGPLVSAPNSPLSFLAVGVSYVCFLGGWLPDANHTFPYRIVWKYLSNWSEVSLYSEVKCICILFWPGVPLNYMSSQCCSFIIIFPFCVFQDQHFAAQPGLQTNKKQL